MKKTLAWRFVVAFGKRALRYDIEATHIQNSEMRVSESNYSAEGACERNRLHLESRDIESRLA